MNKTSRAISQLKSYRDIVARGIFWNVIMAGANKIVTLLGQVILVWILVPADMGLANMAISMAGFAMFLGAGSVGDVLIQRGKYKIEAMQGLWLSFFLSISTSFLILLAGFIAFAMHRLELSKLIFILSIFPMVDVLTPVLLAGLKTNLDFKHIAVSSFVSGVIYTICSVLFAFWGMGPYALILSFIPRSIGFWGWMLLRARLPKFQGFNFSLIKKILKPSLAMSLLGFLIGLQTQAPVFCIGLISDSSTTGHFSWGWLVASQAVFLLSVNLRQVLLPIFAKMKTDLNRHLTATFNAAWVITAVLTLVCGAQFLLAEPIVNKYLPPKWYESGPVITWISIGLIFQGIQVCVSAWLNALGEYRKLLLATFVTVALEVIFTICGYLDNGLIGSSIGNSLGFFAGVLFSLGLVPWIFVRHQISRFVFPISICFFFCAILKLLESFHENFQKSIFLGVLFILLSAFVWYMGDRNMSKRIFKIISDRASRL